MNKKIVWLPYDFDTALGINNEGALAFGYELEDTDHLTGGADVYNGQESVVWNNIRRAFADEIKAMYQELRSHGDLSYQAVEQAFEAHQDKWGEAIFNEDAYFKYLAPLVNPDAGAEPTASYLSMLQGSKKEQRKWWLYNRFRYIDSKYNAGDALSDVIQLRGYAKANVTVTPYADVYASVKFGSYLVQERGHRNTPSTLICPLDSVNDTEIYIYSASQLSAVGDLSGLKVGFADFSNGTKLSLLKVGDSDSEYTNPNLKTLYVGNNGLLQTLDVRNCTALGTDEQTTVDLSGATNIENVYFDGTAIKGVTLPNGGILKVLHLPSTVTNLTVMNQNAITDFTMPSYANITTLRIENSAIDARPILNSIAAASRVRLIGFTWEMTDATAIDAILDVLDTMRGLDEHGNNTDTAQVAGTIHTDTLTGDEIEEFTARYSYISFTADHVTVHLYYHNPDGSVYYTEDVVQGGNGVYTGQPSKASTAQYSYTFAGWSYTDDNTVDADCRNNVTANRHVYPCYTATLRTYTATFVRASADGGGTLYTQTGVPYGTTPTYGGATPTTTQGDATDYPFEGWNPALAGITGDTTYTAKFGSPVEVAEITDDWATILANIENGTYSTAYKVGNYKPLDLGTEGTVNMQIVAKDKDVLADGVNTAPLTFVSIGLLSSHRFNPALSNEEEGTGAIGGWGKSELRKYLKETIKPLIPNTIRSAIKGVVKYTNTYGGTSVGMITNQSSIEDVWIPSRYEMQHDNESNYKSENLGVRYNNFIKSGSDRIKYAAGDENPSNWWARSSYNVRSFIRFQNNGDAYYSMASNSISYPLCFCLGTKEITDSWADIKAACQDGTYASKYSVGMYKPLDLGTEGVVKMEIVGIDADEKADGTGTAPLTFISKELLKTSHRMNPARTGSSGAYDEGTGTIGGWDKCEMKSYLLNTIAPLVPSAVRSAVEPVTKYTRIYNTAGRAENDVATEETFWIASRREMFGAIYNAETQGPIYSEAFPNDPSRKKSKVGTPIASQWWLRSADYSENFEVVKNVGTYSNDNPSNLGAVALGFCF
jgi:hypothetical protein